MTKGIGPEFKIKKGKDKISTENYWGTVRVTKDTRTGDDYIDVLIGKKNVTAPHIHVGINLDQSLRFVEPRGELVKIRREVTSKMHGDLLDESIKYKQDNSGADLTFSVIVDDPSKTIEVKFKELTLKEK